MNFLLGYLVFLPAILAGGLLVHQLWGGNQPARLLFKFGLGAGLGLGMTSLVTFILLLTTNTISGFFPVQLLLLGCGLALTWRNWKTSPLLPVKFALTREQKILLSAFGLILLVMLSAYILYALMTPSGRFDAWMIYNRAARFIYRDPPNWRDLLSSEMYWLFHADYPLLIPVNVAGAWNTLGGEIMRAPQAQSAYFLLGIFCILMGAIASLRSTGQSLLAGIALLSMPVFFYTAAREEADLTVAFFMLAALALLFFYNRERTAVLVVLAGLCAGLAGWTKNEGLLFLLTGSFAWMLTFYQQRQWQDMKWYLLGLALPLAVILYFKLFLAPPNDLFEQSSSASLWEKLTNLERYRVIAESFFKQIFAFGNGKVSILLLAVYGLIVGMDRTQNKGQPIPAAASAILLQLTGYFLIYVITPHDIHWHLNTSLYRLMIHVFPSMLLVFFVSIAGPETILAISPNPSISHRF